MLDVSSFNRALFVVSLLISMQIPANADTFYVDPNGDDSDSSPGTVSQPFRTIQKAQSVVRAINSNMSADITVYIRQGTYQLSTPLTFSTGDSGTNGYNVIYSSYPGERASLSGGQTISGWTDMGGGILRANVGGLRFRQLYVNGVPAIRARTPNVDGYYNLFWWDDLNKIFMVNSDQVANWNRLNDVEMVVFNEWQQNNLHISSYSVSGSFAYVSVMESDLASGYQSGQRYYLENALEFLDQPGEWYLDSGTGDLYYMPRPGEDIMASAVVIAPALERLIQLQGSLAAPVKNIQFYGLNFENSAWTLPSSVGFSNEQADVLYMGSHYIPGAIHIENADDLRFERNVFHNMGGDGAVLFAGVHRNTFIGNVFQDIAGSAIGIGVVPDPSPADSRSICQGNVIKDNYFNRASRDYRSSTAIFAGYVADLTIDHNEIFDVPYTGVSVGWGWSTNDTPSRGNLIRYNKIHKAMSQLADGAGIYTLSKQPGTWIYENYVYDINKSVGAGSGSAVGIYLDEGSSYMTLENNVIENADLIYFLHLASNNQVVNADGVYDFTPEANTHINNGDDPAAIKANAGIEPAYQDFLSYIVPTP